LRNNLLPNFRKLQRDDLKLGRRLLPNYIALCVSLLNLRKRLLRKLGLVSESQLIEPIHRGGFDVVGDVDVVLL
jgi:hypothetical protein